MDTAVNNFKKNGYLIFSNHFSNEEINYLRENLEIEFKRINYTKRDLQINDLQNENLIKLILRAYNSFEIIELTKTFSRIFRKEISILPTFSIMRNYQVNIEKSHGWHRDCGGELKYDYCTNIISKDNYLFSKCAIYLQENSKDYGGSIDIIEKSNRYFKKNQILLRKLNAIKFIFMNLVYKLNKKIYNFLYEGKKSYFLNSKSIYPKPGSLVFFDSKIIHRGSIGKKFKNKDFKDHFEVKSFKDENTKFAIYSHFGTEEGIDSYMYDRTKRNKKNINELKLWNEQVNLIKRFDSDLYLKMKSLLNNINKKYLVN